MGIPRFAYRMREYGTVKIIGTQGREDESPRRRALAIIDGPSLAHALFHTLRCDEQSTESIATICSYSALGIAAIDWLDNLWSYGFEVSGIYFDGALPAHKEKVRIARLQHGIDKLVTFKHLHDAIQRDSRKSNSGNRRDENQRSLDIARKDLAPPPFLVFAVVEALADSHYADRTWVVPGEADPFCVAAASKINSNDSESDVYLFTNDSDLIVYPCGERTKVVMIDSMVEREDETGKILEAREFWPSGLTKMSREPMMDLIRPAYAMLRRHVTFKAALDGSREPIENLEYAQFAETYSIKLASRLLEELEAHRQPGVSGGLLYSRVSEFVHLARYEQQRLTENAATLRTSKEGSQGNGDDSSLGNPSPRLVMYLPSLFEDPSRGSAWRVGIPFRTVAASMVSSYHALNVEVVECRRAGLNVSTQPLKHLSTADTQQSLEAWKKSIGRELTRTTNLGVTRRWRFVVMQLTLADMASENVALPTTDEITSVLACKPATTWRLVHLHAQLEAEYYSIQVLKQIICVTSADTTGLEGTRELGKQLHALPGIAAFFEPPSEEESNIELTVWRAMVEGYLREAGLVDERAVAAQQEITHKPLPSTKKSLKRKGNMFDILSEGD